MRKLRNGCADSPKCALTGATVGDTRPWPHWVHSDDALRDVGNWLRRYHDVVVDFEPPIDATWRMTTSREQRADDIIGHNDAAPYDAVWRDTSDADSSVGSESPSRLIGFIDWDFAAPCPAIWDLAFVACSWVPMHARDVAANEGFTDFDDRPRRLRVFLDAYQYDGSVSDLIVALRARLIDHIRVVEEFANGGDVLFQRLINQGAVSRVERALRELKHETRSYEQLT